MANIKEAGKESNSDPSLQYELTGGDEPNIAIGTEAPVIPKTFNLLSACTTGITTGATWALLGGSIVWDAPILNNILV